MKQTIPKYKSKEVKKLKTKLSTKDKDILETYLIFLKGATGDRKVKIIERELLMIRDISEVPYDEWDLTKLREFLAVLNNSYYAEATKNDIKKQFKRFLKEQYEDWEKRFKKLRDIRCSNDINHEKVNANTILQEDELEKLVRGAESLRIKSIIILLYETGARPTEILSCLWKNCNLDRGEIRLYSTKNKTIRVVPIKESIIHLKRYKQEFPYPDVRPNDFIFPSPKDRNEHFSDQYLRMIFTKLSIRVLGRKIYPYLLRHTRATELQKKLTAKVYEKVMDHSIKMASRYSHLDKDDIREEMLEKVYHIEELNEEDKQEITKLKSWIRLQGKAIGIMLDSLQDKISKPQLIKSFKDVDKESVELLGTKLFYK